MKPFSSAQFRQIVSLPFATLCVVLISENLLPPEVFAILTVSLALLFLAFAKFKIDLLYAKFIWPLLGVLVLGIPGILFYTAPNVLRDIAYALMPIALVYIGYRTAGRVRWLAFIQILILLGFLLACIHLSSFIMNPELLSASAITVREEAGVGAGDLAVLGLVLSLFQYRVGGFRLLPGRLCRFIVLAVCLISVFLSFSRIGYGIAVIFSLALWGIGMRLNLRLGLGLGLIFIGVLVLVATTPQDGALTLRHKLVRSLTEVTIADYSNESEIHVNWRGYEAYKAIEAYRLGGATNILIGQGFGAVVDLGFYMKLGHHELRYIPIHNGYAYILLKTGLLGLLFYAIFYFSVLRYAIRKSRSLFPEQIFLARLLYGCGLSLMLTMLVVGGMAQFHNHALIILLGLLIHNLKNNQSVIPGPNVIGAIAHAK